ncbi:MAG: carbon storage regulator CsrA [Candidatus Marinimicrobia bacterium]|nr:carbon storage regulator CsrA [Candidatus Neomarinimicrobiota bacterium]RKY58924.1 MAG: carbon storage regulator [Candidatus Neomarinimicrobiota bacterium]
MLVLTRKPGESIRIGNDIIITIIDRSSGAIKVGIDAPVNVPVYREELYKHICLENKNAVLSTELGENILDVLKKGVD